MCILLSFLDDEEDEPSTDINDMSARLAEVVILKASVFSLSNSSLSGNTYCNLERH